MVNSDVLAIIPARGGSTRLPKKNIIPFMGKPMIAWSIEAAIKISRKYSSSIAGKHKNEIVSFSSSFHGRTMLGIALSRAKHLIDGFAPLPKGIKNHPYNDIDKLDDLFSDRTAAVK